MHADGMTFCLRCNLVETADLNRTEETEVDPHMAPSCAETTIEMATTE